MAGTYGGSVLQHGEACSGARNWAKAARGQDAGHHARLGQGSGLICTLGAQLGLAWQAAILELRGRWAYMRQCRLHSPQQRAGKTHLLTQQCLPAYQGAGPCV